MLDIRIKKDYIILKSPEQVLSYVQRLVNNIRREGLELDPNYLCKIIYLLNTWLSAYKSHLENVEVAEIKERLLKLEEMQQKVKR